MLYFNPWRMTRHLVRPSRAAKMTTMPNKFKAFRTLPDGTRENWTAEFLAINSKKLDKLPAKPRISKQKHVLFRATKGPMAGHMLDLSMGHDSAKTFMFTMNGQTGFYAGGNWYALENLATDCPDAWRAWNAPAPAPVKQTAAETAQNAAPAPEIEPVAPVLAPAAYAIATKATAPDARSVATVIAEVGHIDLTAPKPEKQAKETPPAPAKRCQHADPIQARASARKRQLQRALAGQLAPHLVANLERCGLMRDGQATRKGRFLYLDDATI